MTRITGQQARELLDGSTPGPWKAHGIMRHPGTPTYIVGPDGEAVAGNMMGDGVTSENSPLVTAAPDLAETVAWLYGREPDGHKHTWEDIPAWRIAGDSDYMEDDVDVWVPRYGGRITVDRIEGNLTPKQAVELARALLAAAEESRNV